MVLIVNIDRVDLMLIALIAFTKMIDWILIVLIGF